MTWVATAVAVSVANVAAGLYSAEKGRSAAKKQAKAQALTERKLTQEKLYQLEVDERQAFGETLAGYVGGGVQVMPGTLDSPMIAAGTPGETTAYGSWKDTKYRSTGRESLIGGMGSVSAVLREQATSFKRERDITKEVGASNVAQTLLSGKSLADRYRFEGISNAAATISSTIFAAKMLGQ